MTANTFTACANLVDEAVSASKQRKMVEILDDLSNELCLLADMADCVRILHPDSNFRDSALEACLSVSELVEKLNTNFDLYNASIRGLEDHSIDEIDARVLKLFVTDFQLSGVHLANQDNYSAFVESSSVALRIGQQFFE
ncbi:hypothetical protein Ciccas_012666, partial [Cichlidogyrus casuarinus]